MYCTLVSFLKTVINGHIFTIQSQLLFSLLYSYKTNAQGRGVTELSQTFLTNPDV